MLNLKLRIPIVLFDLGHTLIYFDADWVEIFQRSYECLVKDLRSAGYAVEPRSFVREFGQRLEAYRSERESEFIEHTTLYVLRNLLDEMGYPEASEEHLRAALKSMYSVSQEYWRVETETLEVLETLRRQGYRMGIVSNAADDADVQVLVDQAHIRPFFDLILSSAQAGRRKPHPSIYQTALQTWSAQPQQAVMVGDTLGADVLGARGIGMHSVWITRRADRPDNQAHEDTILPDAIITSLAELPALLADWDARPIVTSLP